MRKPDKGKSLIHQPCANLEWCNRTLCGTIEDMRNILKSFVTDQNANTGIFMVPMSAVLTMSSLVEEMQVYGNRMENHLGDFKTYEEILNNRDALKLEHKAIQESKRKNR